MTRRSVPEWTSKALLLLGIGSIVLAFSFSALTAPDITAQSSTDSTDDDSFRVAIGLQSGTNGFGGMDEAHVRMINSTGTTLWEYGDAHAYFDVSVLDNGTVLTAFMKKGYESGCEPYDTPCSKTGFRLIKPDPEPHVIREYTFPVRSDVNSEVHDVELLSSGEVVLTDMDRERVFTVNGDEITWSWNASSRYDAPPDPTKTDWLHINDVDYLGDDRFLVSVRNANQLVIIERGAGVQQVINADESKRVLNQQHNPQQLTEDAVLVADSHNDRVVELTQENGEWTPGWTLHDTGEVPFDWPRDADRLPDGRTLITDTLNNRVVMVDQNGTELWSHQANYLPYEADYVGVGESATGPVLSNSDSSVNGNARTSIPVVSYLLDSARHVVALPFWVTELHVLVLVGGLITSGFGGYLEYAGNQ
ncbi:aryl-sulfate sulfotransferase [Halocatena halophila]|uniref:aryl-sulfate sulfotransferase n=1 Tax=Halocatena halophila TaxID=2814576 RepID=UPI002ED0280C